MGLTGNGTYVEAIVHSSFAERALDIEQGCAEVLHQIAAVRGAINGLMAEVLEQHVRTHIAAPSILDHAERTQGADELISVLRSYLK